MNRYVSFFLCSCAAVLVFACGYTARDYLGQWIIQIHSGSVSSQVAFLAEMVSRVLLSAVVIATLVLIVVALMIVLVAVVQELHWNFLHRRIISRLFRRVELQREEDEENSKPQSERPKIPVSALRHAQKSPAVDRLKALKKKEFENLSHVDPAATSESLGDDEEMDFDSSEEEGEDSPVLQRPLP